MDTPVNKEALIEQYVRARDMKKAIMDEAKGKCGQIDEVMKLAEARLLELFEAEGVTSVRTEAGTAYRSTRTSATVADWELLLDHIKDEDAWALLEHRVNKKAVEEYKEEYNDFPPGVNIRSEHTINIRRS